MSAPRSPGLLVFAALAGMAASFAVGYSLGRQSHPSSRSLALAAISDPSPASSPLPVRDRSTPFAYCLPCHRPDGLGIPGVFPPLVGSARLLGDPRVAAAIALHGFDSSGDSTSPRWGGRMVGLPHVSDEDLAAALTFARNSWGNQASAIDTETVAAVRRLSQSRSSPWTPADLTVTFTPSPVP